MDRRLAVESGAQLSWAEPGWTRARSTGTIELPPPRTVTRTQIRAASVVFLTLVACVAIPAMLSAQARPEAAGVVNGVVATQAGSVKLGGAQVVIRDAAGRELASVLSGGDGQFHIPDVPPGKYTVVVSLEGFVPADVSVTVPGQLGPLAIDLAIATLTATVDVVAPAAIVSSADTLTPTEGITSKDVDRLAPGGGLQAALRLLASVIEVPGGVSIKGGRPTQSNMQIGATTLTEPGMGLMRWTLPDDAVDSVAVLPNPYAVEYGRFSSGLVVIQTRRAGDQWKLRLNNLVPTFRTKRHEELYTIKGIATFEPRLEASGPIVKDRLFLEQTAQYRYGSNDVPSRPENELQTSQWFSSFTRVDAAVSPKHSLIAMGGFFPSVSSNASLGTFVPPGSTIDLHERVNHAAVTERALWRDTLVGESTVQVRGYRSDVMPQGSAPMELLPETRAGNFYNVQRRTPTTFQWIDTLSGSANGPTGLHLFKIGVDILHNSYEGASASRPVLIRREDGTLVRLLTFNGPTTQSVRSTDVALFAQDRVQPTTRWYVEYGGRLDRDGVLQRWNATPRVGTALLLNESGTQVLRGGVGLFYERTPSVAGAFGEFEEVTETRFAADGLTPLALPITFAHAIAPNLNTARSRTYDISYDYRWNPHWSLHLGALDRRGLHELVVDSTQQGGSGAWTLSSDGRSQYREVSVGVHVTRSPRADLNVTYALSAAHSDANNFASFFDTMMWPIIGPDAYAVAGNDVPHRFFARGYVLPTPRWMLVGVFDWRTGTPYSVVDEALDFVGARNDRRLPNRARVELGVEHRFAIGKWKPWIGLRAYNVFDAFLPSDVQANLGSPNFGTFYNSEYRQLRLQVRFER
jgi:hypothetical protein